MSRLKYILLNTFSLDLSCSIISIAEPRSSICIYPEPKPKSHELVPCNPSRLSGIYSPTLSKPLNRHRMWRQDLKHLRKRPPELLRKWAKNDLCSGLDRAYQIGLSTAHLRNGEYTKSVVQSAVVLLPSGSRAVVTQHSLISDIHGHLHPMVKVHHVLY